MPGLPMLCMAILPARLPQPMPMFLMAPPKPVSSWPLKWVRLMKMSASMMARPMKALWKWSQPSRGTSISSVPLRPSAMIIWQPVLRGEKPFSCAAARCSRACLRRPTYRVLQSVRKGRPPREVTLSATTLAKLGRRKDRLPGSPKWILMATNLLSMSMLSMPAFSISFFSLSSRPVPTGQRMSVK